jgi:hypothetical protein
VGLQEGLLAQIEGRIDNFSKRPGVGFRGVLAVDWLGG